MSAVERDNITVESVEEREGSLVRSPVAVGRLPHASETARNPSPAETDPTSASRYDVPCPLLRTLWLHRQQARSYLRTGVWSCRRERIQLTIKPERWRRRAMGRER